MNKVIKMLKVKGMVIGVLLFHLFTFSPLSVQAKEYKYAEVAGDLMSEPLSQKWTRRILTAFLPIMPTVMMP